MADSVRDCYDGLAHGYNLMFEDWNASIERQAGMLAPILERECGAAEKILDCACGIGTQALGLASLGFKVVGSDLSSVAIERARFEMTARGLEVPLYVADMHDLAAISSSDFDAVICLDNALPHLHSEADLARAAVQIRSKLRPGGLFAASIRDYDKLMEERPMVQGPAFYTGSSGRRRIVFQVWDWVDDRSYRFHLYITQETPDGWVTQHHAAPYRAIRRAELTRIVEAVGFTNVRWSQTDFYQPVVLANA